MKRTLIAVIEVAAILLVGGGAYYLWTLKNSGTPLHVIATTSASPTPAVPRALIPGAPVPAATQFPIPTPSVSPGISASAPPPLDASDEAFGQQLAALLGAANVEHLFNATDIIRRIVSTTINATGKALPSTLSPFKPLGSPFVANTSADGVSLSEEGFRRYSPYVKAISKLDVSRTAAIYIRFYPLFQAAYADLGTPGYFNDRLVEAIDNCLAAPDPKAPVALVQPTMVYKFADPKLESLSAAQKILVRMGPENAIVVKEKLRQFRELVAHQGGTN